MQLVGANIVLRLIDGGRGDDDLTMNGVVSDLGGPAFAVPAPQLPGDYNLDHTVNAADYVLWRKNSGSGVAVVYGGADGNGDGKVGAEDYNVWRSHFGQTSGSAPASAWAKKSPKPTASMALRLSQLAIRRLINASLCHFPIGNPRRRN